MSNTPLIIYCDGGARGNPGPGGVGVVVKNSRGEKLFSLSRTIGRVTNNEAEYKAVILMLSELKQKHLVFEHAYVHLDSRLVVEQLNGVFRVKEPRLRALLLEVRTLEAELGKPVVYKAIPRAQNQEADLLVNQALDQELLS